MKAILLLCLCNCAPHCWTKRDIALESVFVAATALDWATTARVVAHCEESNPIIGACGQNVHPAFYFPFVMASHVALTGLIDDHWRQVWIGAAAGAEATQAWTSYSLGWRP